MPTLFRGFEDIGINLEFDNLRLLCGFVEKFLEREQKDFQEALDKKNNEIADEYKEEYELFVADNHWYLFEVFPSLQWMSLFNSSYGAFEKNINYICEIAGRHVNANITLKDIAGQGIERAKTYLTKVVGIHEPFITKRWQNIKKYAELRNILVHAAGELDLTKDNHKKVFEYATKHSSIKVKHNKNSEFAEITLSPKLVFEAIEDFRAFIKLLNHQDIKVQAD